MINLFVNLYIDKNTDRQSELCFVLKTNVENIFIKKVYAIVSDSDVASFYSTYLKQVGAECDKLVFIELANRPTFNDYFALTDDKTVEGYDKNSISIIANGDIYFDETLNWLPDVDWSEKKCFALTRWDILPDGGSKFLNLIDSQDAWIFQGPIAQMEGADFSLGTAGCDNSIAYRIRKSGYNLYNPSHDIKSYHLHNVPVLNYTDANGQPKQTVSSPYILLRPCTLHQAKTETAEKFFEYRP